MRSLRSLLLCVSLGCSALVASEHPGLIWSAKDVAEVRAELGKHPRFDQALQEARDLVEVALSKPIDVPKPLDAAGYTHERHKLNYREMQAAGLLYQLTGDPRLVEFIRAQLKAYAALYPTLGRHPAGTGHSPGRIFWQTLNECVWLVNVSQAYDFVYNALSSEDRAHIEKDLLRPMCRFFTEDCVKELDRLHNHGTWTVTAVAMAGFAMGDQDLVDKALYGSKKDGQAGFLKQLEKLYSPDGLYCEGAYYGRYAILPFYLLGSVLEQQRPELKIFSLRDGLLRKALHTQLQLTESNGAFLPFNDSLKEKSHRSPEILFALAEVYAHQGRDAALLDVARRQGAVALSPAGMVVARDLDKQRTDTPYPYSSLEFRDGPEGRSGGLGVLRAGTGDDQTLLCMKYGIHGMEHGHYDKLSFQYHNQGREILPDYGAARFLNVDQKKGGRYLPENKSYALQTVAHNTIVVDGRSQFDGNYAASEASHSERHFAEFSNPSFQVLSAREDRAYPGVGMLRTLVLLSDPRLPRPLLVDVYRLKSDAEHVYDYVLNYNGQFLSTNAALKVNTLSRTPLGKDHGYQHLWLDAEGPVPASTLVFTWMNGERFYSFLSATDKNASLLLTSLGANDPHFNLRRERGLLLRRKGASVCFASAVEAHGQWDPNKEFCHGNTPDLQKIEVLLSDDTHTVVRISTSKGARWTLLLNAGPASATTEHVVKIEGKELRWTGNASLISD